MTALESEPESLGRNFTQLWLRDYLAYLERMAGLIALPDDDEFTSFAFPGSPSMRDKSMKVLRQSLLLLRPPCGG